MIKGCDPNLEQPPPALKVVRFDWVAAARTILLLVAVTLLAWAGLFCLARWILGGVLQW